MIPAKLRPLYQNDPIVHHCMAAHDRGLPLEAALVECVIALAQQSSDMQKRLVDVARTACPVYLLPKPDIDFIGAMMRGAEKSGVSKRLSCHDYKCMADEILAAVNRRI